MGVKKITIIRTAVLALALINQVLTATGKSIIPITDEELTELLTNLFTIGASIWSWWENNSFTKEAIQADKVLETLKSGGVKHG